MIQRRAAPGDAHPLPARFVRRIFERVPLEYLHGLAYVELRARTGAVGHPFGSYRPSERGIVLYSLPPVWEFPSLTKAFRRSLERFHATIEEPDPAAGGAAGFRVSWRDSAVLALWFYSDVFAHELGHHKRYKYQHKTGRVGRRRDEEAVAELHARRLTDQLFADFRARRAHASKQSSAAVGAA